MRLSAALVAFAVCIVSALVSVLLIEVVKCSRDTVVGDVQKADTNTLQARLRRKNILVVGATRGIGRGIAKSLAQAGASVIVVGRSVDGGNDVVRSMATQAPFQSEQTFGSYAADLSTVRGCLQLTQQLRAEHASFDHVVFTVGAWPDRDNPRTADGVDKVVALDLLARFVILKEIMPLLKAKSRVMNVLASAYEFPLPSVSKLKYTLSDEKVENGMTDIMPAVGVSGDAFLQEAAVKYPELKFIGTHPGLVATDLILLSNTFPSWIGHLAGAVLSFATMTPLVLTEEACGLIHANILSSPNVEKRQVTYFNHQLEGRRATNLAYDASFRSWLWSFLDGLLSKHK